MSENQGRLFWQQRIPVQTRYLGSRPASSEEDMVTAQAEGPLRDPRITPIAHTIDAVAAALPPSRRMEFYREVGQAEEGEQLNTALRAWWMEAMFEQRPGRGQRLADVAAGRGLVALPDEEA